MEDDKIINRLWLLELQGKEPVKKIFGESVNRF